MGTITLKYLLGYLILYAAGFMATVYLYRRYKKRRPPLEFEHLRLPGESLSREIEKQNEKLAYHFILSLVFPASLFLIFYIIYLYTRNVIPSAVSLSILAAVSIAGVGLSYKHLYKSFRKVANMELGMWGERTVADMLKPLEHKGWRIFHDVPASKNGRTFNLDHVAVGPGGIAVVETKTRRKGKCLPGREDHEVHYDGKKLEWPWGSSTSEIQQTLNNCKWIKEFLLERLGTNDLPVRGFLAIPGWKVRETMANAPIRAIIHHNVPAAIEGRGSLPLDVENIYLISRQLESICRIKQ